MNLIWLAKPKRRAPIVPGVLVAFALFLWLASSSCMASVAYMRPNSDVSEYNSWLNSGSSSHWNALDDNAIENQPIIKSDYVTASGTYGSGYFRVGLSDIHLGEATLASAKAWIYISGAKTTLKVRDGYSVIASQTFATSGWHSLSVPIAGNLQSRLAGLQLEFTKESLEKPEIHTAFIKLNLDIPISGRSFHIGISANSRSAKTPGSTQDQVVPTGASRLREDLEWSVIQPSPSEWTWVAADQLFREAAERDLSILPILNSPPCWAVPQPPPENCDRTYPTNNSDFAAFVAQAVSRYGPGGTFWQVHPELDPELAPRSFEIWNEPYYMASHKGEQSAARYADLYVSAVEAGRKANKNVNYLVEATYEISNSSDTGLISWLGAMLTAEPGLGAYVDGVAVHPYPQQHDPFYEPGPGVDASLHNAKRIYDAWKKQGINKPIWITEVGYSACAQDPVRCVPGDTQAQREEVKAQWLTSLFDVTQTSEYAFVHAVYLYNLREWTPQAEPSNDHEEWYGILDSDKSPLPAWQAFANAVEKYDGVPEPNSMITGHTIGYTTTFKFVADDPTASFECKLDAGAWTPCVSPKSYAINTSGHVFSVRARNYEAIESSPATFAW